ncbi:MAG: TIGR04084 family radical SAM/SPASM domain-containing protein [Thermoproteota archaeon]|nr:TIGR04084 family radical SAM/SPASM domain-containing protein [Candidatus Brockarchaeota archaeon]
MLYILFTTGKCNLRCEYCGGSFGENEVPWKVQYKLDDLKRLIEHDNEATIAFYGGEPLMNPNFIIDVMENIKVKRFVIQTNGTLVRSLPEKYWKMFSAILISVDGVEEVNDKYRGKGAYKLAISAANYLREIGFNGDLIARMTITEDSNIFRDVMHLLGINLFDHVHWQLNFIWSKKWRNLNEWIEQNYKIGLKKLFDIWLNELRNKKVLGIAPFQGILKRILDGGVAPPCESGVNSVSVNTNGEIIACPIAVRENWAKVGNIRNNNTLNLKSMITEPCTSCEYFKVCGGRCLYTYKERFWGENGFKITCDVTKFTIDLVKNNLYEILGYIKNAGIKVDEVKYPSFNNTVEIIP